MLGFIDGRNLVTFNLDNAQKLTQPAVIIWLIVCQQIHFQKLANRHWNNVQAGCYGILFGHLQKRFEHIA